VPSPSLAQTRLAAAVGSDPRVVGQARVVVEDDVRSSGCCNASSRADRLVFRVVRDEISLDPLDRDGPIVAPLHDMNIAVRHVRGIPTDKAVETPRRTS